MKRVIVKHIVAAAGVSALIGLYLLLDIGCPIRYFTGVPCPTCGVTRSVFALMRLDFAASFAYYPMLFPLLAALFMAIHRNVLPFSKKINNTIVIILAVMVFAVYLVRLFLNIII